tara:strand:+ start:1739 stop:2038 length:300 start_codon:yes stop_codon:yes gene_type:complete
MADEKDKCVESWQQDKCEKCGADVKTADVFEEAIHAQVHMCQQAGMPPMDVIITGLGYFMKMNYFCAPDAKTADELIDDMKKFYRENQDTSHKEVKLNG